MFSERLKGLREKSKLSQEEVSRRLGIARTTYSGYERGTSEPDFNTLVKIAEFYNVDMNWMITGESKHLSKVDEKLLEKFTKLNAKDQETILELINRLGNTN